MALTPSAMLALGTPLPAFSLEQVAGQGAAAAASPGPLWSSSSLDQRPVLVLFVCAHCPFVKHIEPEISRLQRDYDQRLQIVAISSNSTLSHPQDGPEGLRAQAERNGWTFPYLFDASQAVARSFQAACTPDLYLFSGASGDAAASGHQLVYRGQLDDSRPSNGLTLNGAHLRSAIEALLHGQPINPDQQPSIGCNIKWHPQPNPA